MTRSSAMALSSTPLKTVNSAAAAMKAIRLLGIITDIFSCEFTHVSDNPNIEKDKAAER